MSEVITELVPASPLIPGPLEATVRGEKVQGQPLLQNRSLSQIKITVSVDVTQWWNPEDLGSVSTRDGKLRSLNHSLIGIFLMSH